jgi:hypothetical protein
VRAAGVIERAARVLSACVCVEHGERTDTDRPPETVSLFNFFFFFFQFGNFLGNSIFQFAARIYFVRVNCGQIQFVLYLYTVGDLNLIKDK